MKTQHCLKNILMILLSLVALMYLGGCVTAKQKALDAGIKPMTSVELQSLFTEKRTANWNNTEKGRTAIVEYLPDGSQSAVSNGKTYKGTYSIENNEYCSKMDHRNGEIRCTSWFKVDEKKYHLYKQNGSMAGKLTFQ